MLFGPMMEKDTRSVEVVDVEPGIFELLLHFIYTDSLPPCGDSGKEDRLKLMCEDRLCKSIDFEIRFATWHLKELVQP
jgi:speckle-type POZ protein